MSILFFFLARTAGERFASSTASMDLSLGSDSTSLIIQGDTVTVAELRNAPASDTAGRVDDLLVTPEGEGSNRLLLSLQRTLRDREKYMNKLLNNLSYALFLLMPIFALMLKLLYIRRKRLYIEHIIFSVNMHSFALLVASLVLALLLLIKGWDHWAYILLFLIPLYFIFGMKRFYRQGIWKTLGKVFLLGIMYSLLLIFSLTGLVLLTLTRM